MQGIAQISSCKVRHEVEHLLEKRAFRPEGWSLLATSSWLISRQSGLEEVGSAPEPPVIRHSSAPVACLLADQVR